MFYKIHQKSTSTIVWYSRPNSTRVFGKEFKTLSSLMEFISILDSQGFKACAKLPI